MSTVTDTPMVTRDLLMRYDRPGPRYTSYPTAPEWRDTFGADAYADALSDAATRTGEPLAMYIHIPFCHARCDYCGCNTVVTAKDGVADRYLEYLDREMSLVADRLKQRRTVLQMHWGGGTPTYLDVEQIEHLMTRVRSHFTFPDEAELAIEIDPRVTSREQINALRGLGFNRVSMGVQDLNPEVQRAIGRHQMAEETVAVYRWCREAGFEGINFDLVYGLPFQRNESWRQTLLDIIDLRPDRLAVYGYAHVPWLRPHQKRIPEEALPKGPEKYELFATARRLLTEAGYRAIGMDHFALPTDELTGAMDRRRLHRNFMGYTVVAAREMVGFGTSAIGEIGGCYAQNHTKLAGYYAALDRAQLPVARGIRLSFDDEVRRWVIRRLMCDFYLDAAGLERCFGVGYADYFAAEQEQLAPFYADGFLIREGDNLKVQPLGTVFIRNIAMVFDAHLKGADGHRRFSRTI